MNPRRARLLYCISLLVSVALRGGEAPEKEPPSEQIVRQRFLVAYQTAELPERKAETVDMLRELKERESQRLLAGMLGDRIDLVRLRACAAIAATPDPEGYFVKPLMGALADPQPHVRVAAAEALASASVKADAIKALAFALMSVVGQLTTEDIQRNMPVVSAYDKALEKLTGEHSPERGPRGLSTHWMDYWKKHETELRAAEAKLKSSDDPIRPEGLPKDSFDKQDEAKKEKAKN